MKHSSTRDLYDYWQARRAGRAAPERSDIDPSEIPRILADTFLLGAEPTGEMLFRLAGTRVCALFGRELKGQPFVPLFRGLDQTAVRDLIGVVGEETVATIAGATGQLEAGVTADLELILLPLLHRGRAGRRILGLLTPVTKPYWLGMMPIERLALGTFRYLEQPEFRAPPASLPQGRVPRSPASFAPAGRLRHGLIVYDGGRP